MMHLKFPLPAGYFPKFELTPDETLAYKELVTDLVKGTRREYDAYVNDGARQVDTRTWKLAKSKDRLHIYKRRSEFGAAPIGLTGHSSSSANGSSADYSSVRSDSESSTSTGFGATRRRVSSTRSNGSGGTTSTGERGLGSVDEDHTVGIHRRLLNPTMLATGVMDGTVDDIVYALHAPTADQGKMTAALSDDDSLIDTVVLHTIKASKTTYLGLKWKLCRTPGGNRDMCYIEYVGVANDAKNQRYGFRVLESVRLRNCPPFADNSIVRSQISCCYLFRESGTPGIVDVYMQGAFDSSSDAATAGGVGDSRSTLDMLMEVEKCIEIAEAKKLADLVAKQAAAPPRPKQNGSQCSICRVKPGFMSSHLLCQGCGAVICTKCRMKKSIVVFKRGTSSKQKVSCCKICLVLVKEKSPFEGEVIAAHAPATLQAIQKKSSAQSMTPSNALTAARTASNTSDSLQQQHQNGGGPLATTHELALALPTTKLERQRTAESFTDTEYSTSMQSWQSSSVSSSYRYSDLDDSYGSYPSDAHNGHMVLANGKMPVVTESPRSRAHRQYQGQLEYGHPSQQSVGMYAPQPGMGSYPQPPRQGHGVQPPPPMAQHRMDLYNQMLELQMQAERAHNLATQNASMMQQRQS